MPNTAHGRKKLRISHQSVHLIRMKQRLKIGQDSAEASGLLSEASSSAEAGFGPGLGVPTVW